VGFTSKKLGVKADIIETTLADLEAPVHGANVPVAGSVETEVEKW